MADFRKWLFAFAIVALAPVLQTPASAQIVGSGSIICTASAGATPTLRAEGVTELVGDVTLNCSGGTSTPAGTNIPQANVQVFLNTNVTSRLIGNTGLSEALLTIDEPYPTGNGGAVPATALGVAGAPQTQLACAATNSTNCTIAGQGGGIGATGPYNGSAGHPNIFQGTETTNSIVWLGVPIDAPGTAAQRTIRITNVRANAAQLGVSSTLVPTQIYMYISISGSQPITLNNSQVVVGFVVPGMTNATAVAGNYQQCNNLNGTLVGGSAGQVGTVGISVTEGFATAFKVRNYAQVSNSIGGLANSSAVVPQNVLGYSYFTESGFVSNATMGTGAAGFGTATGSVGLADAGTEISYTLAGVGTGVSVFVPTTVYLYPSGTVPTGLPANASGYAVLVSGATPTSGGMASATIAGTGGVITYEVLMSNPNQVETAYLPAQAAFISNTASNLPATGISTVQVNFAPLSLVNTATAGPIPRFVQPHTAANAFAINTCTCNLLFPFTTNQAGFDTGVAIANTSSDPFGTIAQSGIITLNYYGATTGGGAAPAAQKSQVVPAGSELVFTLSSGGNLGVAATPGFQGYIIASAAFQYCHGFAFISDVGAQKLAEGYLAIQLDEPGLNRTKNLGEVGGN